MPIEALDHIHIRSSKGPEAALHLEPGVAWRFVRIHGVVMESCQAGVGTQRAVPQPAVRCEGVSEGHSQQTRNAVKAELDCMHLAAL